MPRVAPPLLFSALAFISRILEDSESDRQGNPMLQPHSVCARLPDSPSPEAGGICSGFEHQHGFTTLKRKTEEINI